MPRDGIVEGGRAAARAAMAALLAMVLTTPLCIVTPAGARQVVVLGIDGLDPVLLQRFIDAGQLPHFARLAAEGDFSTLQTAVAPQSPVAWSNFITGMDAGGHGIFDFVHRDPLTMMPHLSMSRAVEPATALALGSWVLPLSSGHVELLRRGRAFWELLGEHGVPSTLMRMPVDFPPVPAPHHRALSGMGTPDLLGTPGTFSFYTTAPPADAETITGGVVYPVTVDGGRLEARLHGPANPFRRDADDGHPATSVAFTADVDTAAGAAVFDVDGTRFALRVGEWSQWIRVAFPAVPLLKSFSGVARFYLQAVTPDLRLYVTPVQIDPADPVMPISTPPDWSRTLCACVDAFYTQELPQDTKAFTHGIFSGAEFWDQLLRVHGETRRLFEHLLAENPDGLSFYYFGGVDQGCHMLWHYTDPQHPAYVHDDFMAGRILALYRAMDGVLGQVQAGLAEDATLIVMSDHGFAPFYRGVNLNTWLLQRGYLALKDPASQGRHSLFANVDWSRTRAYALGLNGLYVNLAGREVHGIVPQGAAHAALLDSLTADLLAFRDPRGGHPVVSGVTRTRRDLHGDARADGPDLIVGYARGYRSSWESPLGELPRPLVVDNPGPWSADHCIDHRLVPGVLLSNRPISLPEPALYDLTVAILDEFGLPPGPGMIGRDCLGPPAPPREEE